MITRRDRDLKFIINLVKRECFFFLVFLLFFIESQRQQNLIFIFTFFSYNIIIGWLYKHDTKDLFYLQSQYLFSMRRWVITFSLITKWFDQTENLVPTDCWMAINTWYSMVLLTLLSLSVNYRCNSLLLIMNLLLWLSGNTQATAKRTW